MFERLFGWIDRIPSSMQPAAYGALVLASIVAGRILFIIPLMFVRPGLLFASVKALLAATAAGACGGLAYSLVGRRALTIPWIGRYVTGIICVGAYLLPLVLVLPLILPGAEPSDLKAFDLRDPLARNVWLGCTVFFGVLVGQMLFEVFPEAGEAQVRCSRRRRSNDR